MQEGLTIFQEKQTPKTDVLQNYIFGCFRKQTIFLLSLVTSKIPNVRNIQNIDVFASGVCLIQISKNLDDESNKVLYTYKPVGFIKNMMSTYIVREREIMKLRKLNLRLTHAIKRYVTVNCSVNLLSPFIKKKHVLRHFFYIFPFVFFFCVN